MKRQEFGEASRKPSRVDHLEPGGYCENLTASSEVRWGKTGFEQFETALKLQRLTEKDNSG